MSRGAPFFFDAGVPFRLAKAMQILAENRFDVWVSKDLFPEGAKDTVWIEKVARLRPVPIVIVGDNAILKSRAESMAVRDSGLTMFFLDSKFSEKDVWEQAATFFRIWPRIQEWTGPPTPTIYKVNLRGKIETYGPTSTIKLGRRK